MTVSELDFWLEKVNMECLCKPSVLEGLSILGFMFNRIDDYDFKGVFEPIIAICFFVLEEVFLVKNTKKEPTIRRLKNLLMSQLKDISYSKSYRAIAKALSEVTGDDFAHLIVNYRRINLPKYRRNVQEQIMSSST